MLMLNKILELQRKRDKMAAPRRIMLTSTTNEKAAYSPPVLVLITITIIVIVSIIISVLT